MPAHWQRGRAVSATWLLGLLLFALLALPFLLHARRRERASEAAHEAAKAAGLHQPVTLHPVVDADSCIGTGACLSICPEHVIGFRNGQAFALAPACCIGHGLCERVCPVGAIQLVIGTATRGVELPRLTDGFETNVPGLHVIGELGGMGLIRNAFEQGRQCIEQLAPRLEQKGDGVLDLIIIGAGPAGLAASLHARSRDLRFVTLEREDIGGTVRHYPRRKLVLSDTLVIPGYGDISAKEIRKEDLVGLWEEVISSTRLQVNTREEATAVRRLETGALQVTTHAAVRHAQHVVLAIGRRGVPRKLGVPGEAAPHVAYNLQEPEAFQGEQVLVVGGGDSAVEAALALAEQPGNVVRLSYRGAQLARVKAANRERFDAAVRDGRVEPLWESQVLTIDEEHAELGLTGGRRRRIDATRVFIMIGGELPTPFLRACGIEIETRFGTPLR
jgi:thioredoxin reductase/NAD-dependent dihydropyrimidine dehydrogenase PreA subunit